MAPLGADLDADLAALQRLLSGTSHGWRHAVVTRALMAAAPALREAQTGRGVTGAPRPPQQFDEFLAWLHGHGVATAGFEIAAMGDAQGNGVRVLRAYAVRRPGRCRGDRLRRAWLLKAWGCRSKASPSWPSRPRRA